MTIAERFWAKVDKSGDCWIWTATRNPWHYGNFFIRGKMVGAHRVSWELAYGEIPSGLGVLHRCDVPYCVNPSHLFLGTNADNSADRKAKGRAARLFGGKNPFAKLSTEDVNQVRAILATGKRHKEIALLFGVSKSLVDQISSGHMRSRA